MALPTLVQSITANQITTSSALSFTLGSNTTAGNLLIVCGALNKTSDVTTGVTMTGESATWANPVSTAASIGTISLTVWYAFNISGGNKTLTLNHGAVSTTIDGIVAEFSGLQTASTPLDKNSDPTSHGGSTTFTTSVTGTLTNGNELLIAFCAEQGGSTIAWSSPFNVGGQQVDKNVTKGMHLSWLTQQATTTQSATATVGTSTNTQSGILTFKPLPIVNKEFITQAVNRAGTY